ncbi:hypothetical protein BC628DRAFT_1101533 [Trametes gibbosa]|nr:hypothetical protein BC628DRAFT_1101533 [Trametes gibbosa]
MPISSPGGRRPGCYRLVALSPLFYTKPPLHSISTHRGRAPALPVSPKPSCITYRTYTTSNVTRKMYDLSGPTCSLFPEHQGSDVALQLTLQITAAIGPPALAVTLAAHVHTARPISQSRPQGHVRLVSSRIFSLRWQPAASTPPRPPRLRVPELSAARTTHTPTQHAHAHPPQR